MRAVLLDFNGTMFFDTRFHMEAWSRIYHELHPEDTKPLDPKLICGPRNEAILRNMAPWLTVEESERYAARKEEMYRSACRSNPDCVHLVAGAEELMQGLQERGVLFTLASASPKENVDFYFESFPIGRWIQRSDVVYDDGSYADKGAMHLEAARRLKVPFSECLVIEDSPTAVSLAKKNGAGRIVAIGETGDGSDLLALGADHFIRNFTEFDYRWLNS
ncbi:MAG: HAD family phosphatase [Candidatus Faecalibacterium intestinavium]|uniref:HAD family phosphatase n=1 Tax=Candidatus Faecalibacterium intestinavium TaxID=2838580 RepID=A0A9E2KLQ6_9FIRM|nr:HAD family phosphatase [Candidatus Faecalibacterium intestinavium]